MGVGNHDTVTVRAHYADLVRTYDNKANRACKRAYAQEICRALGACRRVLEIGAGSSPALGAIDAAFGVACDLSLPMLAARGAAPEASRVVADGQRLPFCDGAFDGVFCVNVLEHAPDPSALLAEAARVLVPGGRLLAITPNGDVAWLLDLLERLRLKLPEGPHRFLTCAGLASIAGNDFDVLEHRRFLAFPAGPVVLVEMVDRVARGGLFQLIALARR